jgi:cobalt-zinc-cadmium efflux system outer membrane protein
MKIKQSPVACVCGVGWPRASRLRGAILAGLVAQAASAQVALTWPQLRARFEAANPSLKAAQAVVDESRAAEITAYLRPNPQFTGLVDQLNPFKSMASPVSGAPVYRPLAETLPSLSFSYLHERERKRELRLESAQQSAGLAVSGFQDEERGLLFTLRNSFVATLQAKAFLDNARENLDYWDRVLGVNRTRYQAGDLAQVDLDRLELQRVQFESDLETATVNLRTAKIELLLLLDDRTPVEQFDVSGPYQFSETLGPLEEFREAALAGRPDLKAATQAVELARTNHALAVANGSTDPTFAVDVARNPPIPSYFGVSVTIPVRLFDRNQGEKARTQIDIDRSERARQAAEAQVYGDVEGAYATLGSAVNLLRPYRDKYLQLAADTRDRIARAYQNGGASLLDYLDAEKAYRDTRLAYLNLIGAYLSAAAQMNLAVGREVMP